MTIENERYNDKTKNNREELMNMNLTYDFHNSIPHSDDENQSTEWKWSWSDEYLKWLCGYANMDGGTLYLGVNDDGYVVGLENARNLLEILPNKIS